MNLSFDNTFWLHYLGTVDFTIIYIYIL